MKPYICPRNVRHKKECPTGDFPCRAFFRRFEAVREAWEAGMLSEREAAERLGVSDTGFVAAKNASGINQDRLDMGTALC